MMGEFKLKELRSADLRNGEKRECEVEGVEQGKVVLVRVNDRLHALTANCTHYGAPLVKGVVSAAGRITCPWHGACFNIATGDVEDAPALDPLGHFDILEKDGGVYIRGEEAFLRANRRALKLKCSAQGPEHVVVVGGGSGAIGVIEGLREGGYNGLLTVITKEGHRPIDRTKLSKSLLTDLSKLAWRSADFYRDAAVDLVSDEVTGIDFTQQCVQTASGTPHSYTKLVLATGAAPRSLPLPGLRLGDLANVFLLRTLADAQAITAALGADGRKKVVVIGSSFIGMEVANCLAGMKHDVTVVGMEATPLEHVMGARVGKIFQTLLERSGGVKFCMSAAVERASAAERADTTVGAVHLKDGTALAADVVIEGVGVAPATSYLRDNASVRLEQDGSLLTDDRFRVAALGPANDSVFAIGDIATYPYHGPGGDGRPTRIEHWNVAQNAGRSVAADIVAASAPADGARRDNTAALGTRKPFIPVFWSALGAQLRYCGSTVGRFDDVLFVGDEDKPSFVAYYTRDDTVVAVASMQKDPYMTQAAELMRHGQMPSKSAIQGGVDILAISVPSQIKI